MTGNGHSGLNGIARTEREAAYPDSAAAAMPPDKNQAMLDWADSGGGEISVGSISVRVSSATPSSGVGGLADAWAGWDDAAVRVLSLSG